MKKLAGTLTFILAAAGTGGGVLFHIESGIGGGLGGVGCGRSPGGIGKGGWGDLCERHASEQPDDDGDHHGSQPEQYCGSDPDDSGGMEAAGDRDDQRVHIPAVAGVSCVLAGWADAVSDRAGDRVAVAPNVRGAFNSGARIFRASFRRRIFLTYYLGTMQGGVHVVGPMPVPAPYSQWAQGWRRRGTR